MVDVEYGQDTDELLANVPIDDNEIKSIKKKSQLDGGWYTTVTPLKVRVVVDEEHSDANARIVKLEANVEGEKGKGRIWFSFRNKEVLKADGKPDNKSKLYAQLRDAYNKAYGARPTSLEDLVKYITEYPVQVRLVQGSDSPWVSNIRPVRG